MTSASFFSESYEEARNRFRDAASQVGAELSSYGIGQDGLTIDVATVGREADPTIVVSSGVHGAEGFFGSAIQLSLLDSLLEPGASSAPVRYVLIHSLNPFGFANLRRFDENNVDLNRNFLESFESLPEAPELYARLNRLLNPESPCPAFDPFVFELAWAILRFGKNRIKAAIAGGQYQFPRGLFFGGSARSNATRIVQENCDSWIGSARTILHLDLHSGLGRFADYQMLITEAGADEDYAWHLNAFGPDHVQSLQEGDGVAYPVFGLFGKWMKDRFADRVYRFAAAEFGTHSGTRVLTALRAENRAHHFAESGDPNRKKAKEELLECFCPRDQSWRRRVVQSGKEIMEQAANALTETTNGTGNAQK